MADHSEAFRGWGAMKPIKLAVLVFAVFLAGGKTAHGGGVVGECIDGQHHLSIGSMAITESAQESPGFILKREAIGICEEAVFVPDDPIPFSMTPWQGGLFSSCQASVVLDCPDEGVLYKYTPYFVHQDGTYAEAGGSCGADQRVFGYVGCGSAPLVRGTLIFTPTYDGNVEVRVMPCEDDCWTETLWAVMEIDAFFGTVEGDPNEILRQVVDVHGDRTYCLMLGGATHTISRVTAAPEGECGSVPVETKRFAGFRAMYR